METTLFFLGQNHSLPINIVSFSHSNEAVIRSMAAFAWGIAIPTSLYITRSIGSTVSQTVLRNPAPEPLDESIDVQGALASAEAALRLVPVSPTANHLRSLVESGAQRLRELLAACKDRQRRRTFSRLFRHPCFREENSRLRSECETLKSRVHLFLTVVSLFPDHNQQRRHAEPEQKTSNKLSLSDIVDGEEVSTQESVHSSEKTKEVDESLSAYLDAKLQREIGRISIVKAFTKKLTASEEYLSEDADSDTESMD